MIIYTEFTQRWTYHFDTVACVLVWRDWVRVGFRLRDELSCYFGQAVYSVCIIKISIHICIH